MANLRIDAAKILQRIFEDNVFFGEIKTNIAKKDLPFMNMLILTTLRRWMPLNVLLGRFMKKKIPHKHRLAQYLLLSSIAEILFMNTPVYAVINETVQNVRQTTDKFLAGMTNAVLRKIASQKNKLTEEVCLLSPLPPSFIDILKGYSVDEIKQIAQSVYLLPPLDITTKSNPQKMSEKFAIRLLPNGSLRLPGNSLLKTIDDFATTAWVQDVAASFPVQILGDIKGLRVADLCAAPGGKTAQLASAGAEVTAVDISAHRLQKLQENMQRLNLDVKVYNTDALDFIHQIDEKFDIILLDAPCSASGTFRRHPEVLHLKTTDDVSAQVQIQRQILDACADILKIGGILIYSVCSISKAEGEHQIATFLKDNKHFKIVPISVSQIEKYGHWTQDFVTQQGTIRTLPYYEQQIGGMDSFFICKMQRII